MSFTGRLRARGRRLLGMAEEQVGRAFGDPATQIKGEAHQAVAAVEDAENKRSDTGGAGTDGSDSGRPAPPSPPAQPPRPHH